MCYLHKEMLWIKKHIMKVKIFVFKYHSYSTKHSNSAKLQALDSIELSLAWFGVSISRAYVYIVPP